MCGNGCVEVMEDGSDLQKKNFSPPKELNKDQGGDRERKKRAYDPEIQGLNFIGNR